MLVLDGDPANTALRLSFFDQDVRCTAVPLPAQPYIPGYEI